MTESPPKLSRPGWRFLHDAARSHNFRGLAFHEFDLPGVPASHACVRLLARDAMWIYKWGQGWVLDAAGQLVQPGTPVVIVGQYAFGAEKPWLSSDYWTRPILLPETIHDRR